MARDSSSAQGLYPSLFACHISCFYPYFHSLHVLFLFFSSLYLFLNFCSLPASSSLSSDCSISHTCPYQPLPCPSVCTSLDNLSTGLLSNPFLVSSGLRSRRHLHPFFSLLLILSGDIHLNPGPSSSKFLTLGHLNTRSVSSITADLDKPSVLQEFILDNSLDLLSLSETWLSSDTPPSILNSFTPPGFSLIHQPRLSGLGGGVAFVFRSSLKSTRIPLPSFSSFEALCLRLSLASSSINFLTIYRPPSASSATFLSEFSDLLETLATTPAELIITGDFNFHVDLPSAPFTTPFFDLLNTFDLFQHVNFPTHSAGHTLDLLLTRSSSNVVSSICSSDPSISDHCAIIAALTLPFNSRPPPTTKIARNYRSINPTNFSNDILQSALHTTPASSLDSYVSLFNSTLSSILDKHAPPKTVSCSSRPRKPFITPEIISEKKKRSKLETIYRRSKTPANLHNFKIQSKHVSKLITTSRRSFYRSFITNSSDNPRKLWSAFDGLLSRKLPPSLPTSLSNSTLASSFLKFFNDKITKLCSSFPVSSSMSPHLNPPSPPPSLTSFASVTQQEVHAAILSSSNASCCLDPIPTYLLKSCLDALLLPITNIINLSLADGIFPSSFKSATVHPLLKKSSLPTEEFSSYRPISNLSFLSKLLERIIQTQLLRHLQSFPSISPFQSAFRKFHSTETALLRVQNDLLLSCNKQKVSALVLLDLSAAFDTIDHSILLHRLASTFGLSDSALSLLSSYLSNRTQHVSIGEASSGSIPLHTGVPQGSVLGPLLFSLYTSPISYLFQNSPICYHLYADDTQLYFSFTSSDSASSLLKLSSTLDKIYSWLTANKLSVNPDKTEYLLIGTPQQRSKVVSASLSFAGKTLTPSPHARNLGVEFDPDLSLNSHISNVCRSSFFLIRQLRQIRPVLDTKSTTLLANALVSSKLDYCNSLYYNLPSCSLNRLQRIQNSLARVVVPSVKKFDHISPTLHALHWLPIQERITFKIATITFKTLRQKQPSYLFDLLRPYIPSRSLRSSDKHLLTVPLIKSAIGRRSFSFAAPTVWNSLPLLLRATDSYALFRSHLKTFLFPP